MTLTNRAFALGKIVVMLDTPPPSVTGHVAMPPGVDGAEGKRRAAAVLRDRALDVERQAPRRRAAHEAGDLEYDEVHGRRRSVVDVHDPVGARRHDRQRRRIVAGGEVDRRRVGTRRAAVDGEIARALCARRGDPEDRPGLRERAT